MGNCNYNEIEKNELIIERNELIIYESEKSTSTNGDKDSEASEN